MLKAGVVERSGRKEGKESFRRFYQRLTNSELRYCVTSNHKLNPGLGTEQPGSYVIGW
jgi:hypothetical protein